VNKRRNYWIDTSFQLNFVGRFCAVTILSSLAVFVSVIYFFRDPAAVTVECPGGHAGFVSGFLWPVLLLTVSVTGLFASLAVLYFSIRVSHRIAGPAYRLKKDVDAMARGQWDQQFKIRRTDELRELARSLEQLSLEITRRQKEMKRDIRAFLQEYSESTPAGKNALEGHMKKIEEVWEQ
jgi:methyl-accepting chemotaxis protein